MGNNPYNPKNSHMVNLITLMNIAHVIHILMITLGDRKILALGMATALFEGSMYVITLNHSKSPPNSPIMH